MFKKIIVSFLLTLFAFNTHAEGFPDDDSSSGRMLSIHNGNYESLQQSMGTLTVIIPSTETNVKIEIFDGDNNPFPSAWERHGITNPDQLIYELFIDPNIATSRIAFRTSDTMTDDDWNILIDSVNDPSALNATGDAYIYTLKTSYLSTTAKTFQQFKFKSNGSFAYLENHSLGLTGTTQAELDFRGWSGYYDHTPLTYAGDFNFQLQVSNNSTCAIDIYDGDFDRADDDDDSNTPLIVDLPFDASAAVEEGSHPGQPKDDADHPAFAVSPNVVYFISGPGYALTNSNPSGSQEWELFRIASSSNNCPPADLTDPTYDPDGNGTAPAAAPDIIISEIKQGTHNIAVRGLDSINTAFLASSLPIGSAKERQHCAGQMTWLVLEYDGTIANAHIEITQKVTGKDIVLFDSDVDDFVDSDGDGFVDDEELFTIAGAKDSGTFGSNIDVTITDSVSGIVTTEQIITTCANYSGAVLGLPIGSFIIRDGASLNGGLLL